MPRKALVLARAALWFAQKAAGECGRIPTAPNLTGGGMGRAQMRSAWDEFYEALRMPSGDLRAYPNAHPSRMRMPTQTAMSLHRLGRHAWTQLVTM